MEMIREITDSIKITSALDVYQYLEEFKNQDREHFIVLGLNTKNKVIYRDIVSIGILDSAILHPREVFKSAVMKSAHKIIVAHNHPSGDASPSKEDLEIFTKLKEVGEILGIGVLDCVIIGNDGYYSLNEGLK